MRYERSWTLWSNTTHVGRLCLDAWCNQDDPFCIIRLELPELWWNDRHVHGSASFVVWGCGVRVSYYRWPKPKKKEDDKNRSNK